MQKAGSDRAKGLGFAIHFWNPAKKEWVLSRPPVVTLKR
jgi:hypothetical protein